MFSPQVIKDKETVNREIEERGRKEREELELRVERERETFEEALRYELAKKHEVDLGEVVMKLGRERGEMEVELKEVIA